MANHLIISQLQLPALLSSILLLSVSADTRMPTSTGPLLVPHPFRSIELKHIEYQRDYGTCLPLTGLTGLHMGAAGGFAAFISRPSWPLLLCLLTFLQLGTLGRINFALLSRNMDVATEKNKGRPPKIPFALAAVALLIATTQIKRYLPVSAVAFYHDPTIVDGKASLVNPLVDPELTAHAVGCLRLSKPDIPDSIQYPSDAFAHYQDIHLRLSEWTQKEGHVPHNGEYGRTYF